MIRARLDGDPTAAERWAFDLLVDLARLVPATDDSRGGVTATVGDAGSHDVVAEPGAVRIGRGLLDHVVRLGGAAAEQRTAARDRHGRIPASENPAVAEHTERALPLQ